MKENTPKKKLRAVALRYEDGKDHAPRVSATGSGHIAERIIEAARASGVPLRENPVLAESLSFLQPGESIPEDLYLAVAEILAEVMLVDGKCRK